jgi:adrenodoxin-NADP+ reductase
MAFPTQVDILERLPTPFGLVRNGVAPDHPEVKNVQKDFEDLFVMQNNSNNKKRGVVQFWGNVCVGKDVTLYELRQRYDAVVFAFGCESDRSLSIPGSDGHLKKYILKARQFVNWYNGHPEFEWVGHVIQEALQNSINNNHNKSMSGPQQQQQQQHKQHIVVIGHGNVALDCARILAKSRHELDPTDLTTRALDILHPQGSKNDDNAKKHISIVGRRGHIQGAFTIKEVRELTKMAPSANFVVRLDELEAGASTVASQSELEQSRPKKRIDQLLRENATVAMKNEHDGKDESFSENHHNNNINLVHLRFLLNPIRVESNPNQPEALGALVCERTQLQGEVGAQIAVGTGVEESLPADLCLVSIGYKGMPIDGTEHYYNDKLGILNNVRGVVDNSSSEVNNDGLASLYVSGWLKRGPSGIIGTNISDAKETVASIVHDLNQRTPKTVMQDMPSLQQLLNDREVQVVDWKAYLRINEQETSAKHLRNPKQPREKLTAWQELLEAAKE